MAISFINTNRLIFFRANAKKNFDLRGSIVFLFWRRTSPKESFGEDEVLPSNKKTVPSTGAVIFNYKENFIHQSN
jgi:hypothetical protein